MVLPERRRLLFKHFTGYSLATKPLQTTITTKIKWKNKPTCMCSSLPTDTHTHTHALMYMYNFIYKQHAALPAPLHTCECKCTYVCVSALLCAIKCTLKTDPFPSHAQMHSLTPTRTRKK